MRNEQIDSFLDEGFEYKGRKFTPLTAMGMIILERVESPFYTGKEDGGLESVLDYLYVCDSDNDRKELVRLSRNTDDWRDEVLEYADQYSAQDLKNLSVLVSESAQKLTSTLVEVEETDSEGK